MTVLVYGLGRSGLAVCRLLHKQGHTVLAYDAKPKVTDRSELASLNATLLDSIEHVKADLCIAAPGVPYDHPDLIALRQNHIDTIGEVEWVYRTLPATFIGVTGTAGKGSVTQWLTDVLSLAGLKAKAGGNIDPALSAVAQENDVLVTELSSFQLERCPSFKPRIAIITNLGVDHLDRHGSVENYHGAKYNILKNQDEEDVFIYNQDDPKLVSWAKTSRAQTLGFSTRNTADAYLLKRENNLWIQLKGMDFIAVSELQQQAKHQLANAMAVALAAKTLGVNDQIIKQGLHNFKGIEGRYSVIKTIKGITFIEDSIATRTLSVKAALEATPKPIVWIGGGVDKGASFAELENIIKEKVSLFLGIGQDGETFAKRFASLTQTAFTSVKDGRTALEWACMEGIKHLQDKKGTILLAPLAASFDQFKDYKERATLFRQVVEGLYG